MCGITGFIDFKKNTSVAVLNQMTDTLVHRGPDGKGTEILENDDFQIGLGHRRLSILDLSEGGKQPMIFGKYWIVFNGEIYNFKTIKEELIALGHSFESDSDTEMILHAYDQWGAACIDQFIGMFAFVIFNTETKSVFASRDRAGVKPFFYYQTDDLFLFSSELKSFHKHPRFKKELNLNAVSAFMQYGNVPTPHCIFKNCLKLKPGYNLELTLGNLSNKKATSSNNYSIKTKQYWNVYDYYNTPKSDISFADAKQETKTLLKSAFEYRMVSDVPVGVFLSGGFDSACVTSLLQTDRTEKLKTFTIGVPDIGLNEAPYAKDVAKLLGTDHHEYTCTEKEAIELITKLPHFYDEPFADSSALPTMLVSKMAKKEVTVALSADGGDEIFAGYNRYDFLARYQTKLNKIPGFARKGAVGLMNFIPSERIPVLKNKYNFHNRYEKLKSVLNDPSDENIMLSVSQQFTDQQTKDLMLFNPEILASDYNSKELLKENYSPLSYMMAIDYKTYMLDDILQKVDRATMSASLEGREPFLDHRIVEFAATLPNNFKYNNGVKKHILREIVYDYIPKDMMERPKMGFAIPIANWMQNELKDQIENYISETKIKQQGIFNWKYVNKLKQNFFNGKKELDTKLWYLLMFQMWYEKWMNLV